MITIRKLTRLAPATRWRKVVRLFESFERSGTFDPAYLPALVQLVRDADLPPAVIDAAVGLDAILADAPRGEPPRRAVNTLRHLLAAHVGAQPADWDLGEPAGFGAPTHADTATCRDAALERVTLLLESLRSPFNLGSIVRSAAAFGVGRVIAAGCADVRSPRFLRSAMGAESMVDLVTANAATPLGDLALESDRALSHAGGQPLIALELGGTPVGRFHFPDAGVLMVGSEELGLSPGLLEHADYRVTVPMPGRKQSLNVGVAVGIALAFWSAAVSARS